MIGLLAIEKSRYFAQPRPIIFVAYCLLKEAKPLCCPVE